MSLLNGTKVGEVVDRWLTHRTETVGRKLTTAEHAEAHRVALGLSRKESAQLAGLAEETIHRYRTRLYQRLDVRGQAHLLAAVLQFNAGTESTEGAVA